MFATLARSLNTEGDIEVHVGVLSRGGRFEEEIRAAGIPLYSFNKRPIVNWDISVKINRLLKHLQIDILHMHDFSAALWGRLAALSMPAVSRIITDHAVCGWKNPIKHRIVNGILHRYTDRIVALSNIAKKSLEEIEHFPSQRITVIPNGVDIDFIDSCEPRTMDSFGFAPAANTPVIGTLGRYSHEKGGDLFIEAIRIVKSHGKPFTALMCGEGQKRPDYSAMIRSYGLQNEVHLTGALQHQHVISLAKSFNVAVVPSRQENCSMAILELMACKAGIVATDAGGNGELITNERTGLLVPVSNPEAMADAILRLLEDPQCGTKMGQNASRAVRMQFSQAAMIKRYVKVYEDELKPRVSS